MKALAVSWLDRTAIGRPQSHDARYDYNPRPVEAPAISQEQLDYDNQRQIEEATLLSPAMLAFVVADLRRRVIELEAKADDN